jgi:hypothetical protein
MKWLKIRLRNWLNSNDIESNMIVPSSKSSRGLAIAVETENLSAEPLRLSIYRANGGTVVETKHYDRQKDRNQTQLHIIGHNDNLGESIAKIIVLESLRG